LANLSLLMAQINPTYALYRAIVQHYPGSGSGRSNISRTHEYNVFFLPRNRDLLRGNLKNEGVRERGFRRAGTGSNNYRSGRPNSFFAVVVDATNKKIVRIEKPPVDNYTMEDTEEGYKRVFPIGEDGSERVWTLSYEGALEALKDERLRVSDNLSIIRIYHDEANRNLVDSVWVNSKFNATTHGTNLLTDLFGNSGLFSYPKSVYTVQTAIDTATYNDPDAIIIDTFAGSGTTAHAIIKLNKHEQTNDKKYVLVEMGAYFDLVTKPRVQKAIYSDDWQNGKPQDSGKSGSSQIVKNIKLESYEDALNNLKFTQQTDAQRSFLENDKALERNYRINYMLDFESQDSPSLLDVKQFEDPFNYEMLIQDDSNRLVPKNVDLVDTFNYLIGLNVDHIEQKKGFVVVHGKQNDGTRTLIIWRNVNENPNDKLNEFLEKSAYNPRDGEFDVIYVNGDNNVENLQTADDAWKVRLIEEEFHKRMFN
ncbi:site-specific DNA-methyltransferase, partial [Candidatus Saccharibacteria bacterium]|nr:site-specific DNA-methyltransferase [Candidatus Saccharibacteria bacterium]